ncbi:TPA: hypothetical protein ACX6NV_000418 [Photobacterium damselae]
METPKRLQPDRDTLRRLYSLSGNQCAFPGCNRPMFNEEGNFVGQICHIEAALPEGERFNKFMTNEDRRAFSNLMLMCYDHHIETDKVDQYPVWKMRKIKQQHEEIYSNIERFVHQMQSTIVDVTTRIGEVKVRSLTNLYVELYGKDNRYDEDIKDDVQAFNRVLKQLSSFSPDAKEVFSISMARAVYEKNYNGRQTDNLYVDPYEIERVTQINRQRLKNIFSEIERSNFLAFEYLDMGPVYWVCTPNSEVNLWEMIKQYCIKKNLDIQVMISGLAFGCLD